MSATIALPGGYEISADPARIDVDAVHTYIGGESYWARGRDRDTVARCIARLIDPTDGKIFLGDTETKLHAFAEKVIQPVNGTA